MRNVRLGAPRVVVCSEFRAGGAGVWLCALGGQETQNFRPFTHPPAHAILIPLDNFSFTLVKVNNICS